MTNSTDQANMVATTAQTRTPSLKRRRSDMKVSGPPLQWVDEEHYRNHVLRLPTGTDEDEIDQRLKHEAEELGVPLLQVTTNVECITSSLSATTIASDPTNQSSIMSQSTAPTSCSSSEHRPITASTHRSETMPPPSSMTPSIISDMEKKRRNSGFRKGFRKMAGFSRKRKSLNLHSPSILSSIGSGSCSDVDSIGLAKEADSGSISKSIDMQSINSSVHNFSIQSPSLNTTKASDPWSARLMTPVVPSYEQEPHGIVNDHEALRRSMECKEIVSLRARQLEERQRLLDYQSQLLSSIYKKRDATKAQRKETHIRILAEQTEKTFKAIEDFESRQLEEELKMLQEHEADKLKISMRLRHMEAYCQTPSPPATPVDATFSLFHSGSDRTSSSTSMTRTSVDSGTGFVILPERKITDRDYNNLAASYRERDAMDNLHKARINVLRGRQKRAVEKLAQKKEQEIEQIEVVQQQELTEIDQDFNLQEEQCRAELREKRRVLERRWRLQSLVASARQQIITGLQYAPLADITASEGDFMSLC